MNARRLAVGISVVLALVLCAFAAISASAAQQAYECLLGGTEYGDAHCTDETGSGHHAVEIPEATPTPTQWRNWNTASLTTASAPFRIKGHVAGAEVQVECLEVFGEGSLQNLAFGEPFVSGELTITFSECSVIQPALKGCQVTNNSFTTKKLLSTNAGEPAKKMLIRPEAGAESEMFSLPIEKCTKTTLNHEWSAFGSLLASVSGATWTWTHMNSTEQATLKLDGTLAGFEGAVTARTRAGLTVAFK